MGSRVNRLTLRTGLFLFFIALIGLPYLFDVAYCEELAAPTLQAALVEWNEVDPDESKACPLLSDDQAGSVSSSFAIEARYPQFLFHQSTEQVSPQYLPISSRLTRAPPSA
jgi:hypothetical protein